MTRGRQSRRLWRLWGNCFAFLTFRISDCFERISNKDWKTTSDMSLNKLALPFHPQIFSRQRNQLDLAYNQQLHRGTTFLAPLTEEGSSVHVVCLLFWFAFVIATSTSHSKKESRDQCSIDRWCENKSRTRIHTADADFGGKPSFDNITLLTPWTDFVRFPWMVRRVEAMIC